MKYNFIAIEGNIGAGKTSLAKLLAHRHDARLVLEQFADNPFLPQFYKEPDRVAFQLELSFLAERYGQLKNELVNFDLFNKLTVADYFVYKSLIFASNTLKEDELTLYKNLFNIIASTLPKPDLLVYIYVDYDRLQQNIKKRGREYEQNIKNDYLEHIQEGYLNYLKQNPSQRSVILDLQNVDFVRFPKQFENIAVAIEQDFPLGISRVSFG